MRVTSDPGEGGGGGGYSVVNFGWHLLGKYIVIRDFSGVFNKSGKI